MKIINFCYFSKKETAQDSDFLKDQGLSDPQIDAIKLYFYKRISGSLNKVAIFTAIIVIVGYSIDWAGLLRHLIP